MADHFLTKARVEPGDFLMAGGETALSQNAGFRALLEERAGPEVAALFAEPVVSGGNDAAPPTVSWYAETGGDARPLSQLAPGERAGVERYLAEHLRPVQALAADPEHGQMAQAALSTLGPDDVLVVGDRPVIVNWGLMPGGRTASPAAREAHRAATLGRFAPAAARAAAPVPPAPSAAAAATPVAATPAALPRIAWLPLLALLLLAGLVLAWLLWPGTRIFFTDDTPPVITDAAELQAAQAQNEALRARQAALESALAGAVCRDDGQLILPGGLTPEGLTPPPPGVAPEEKAEAAPDAMLPSHPARVTAPDGDGSLLDTIAARTVLVLAGGSGGGGLGSGFVVGPGLVVTNHHVIEDALGEGGRIFVTNEALGAPQEAVVLKSRGPLKETGADFALLKIGATGLPAFTVLQSDRKLALTNIVAAGFPGDVLEFDVGFAALKAGDGSAMPALTVTDGIVNTEQQIGPETHVLMHSAALSTGNSGGPLVDMCGRLLGVNSFVRKGAMQNRGYALATSDLLDFLRGTPADPAVTAEPCAPVVARPVLTEAAD